MIYRSIRIKPPKDEPDILELEEKQLVDICSGALIHEQKGMPILETRAGGSELMGKALYLSDRYEWAIGHDDLGVLVLVPYKKH